MVLTSDAKQRAKTRTLPFSLDWREIQEKIDLGICEVTGIAFTLEGVKAWNAPSLDQIAPGAGYTKLNTRVVLYCLNIMAGTWGVPQILEIAEAIKRKAAK